MLDNGCRNNQYSSELNNDSDNSVKYSSLTNSTQSESSNAIAQQFISCLSFEELVNHSLFDHAFPSFSSNQLSHSSVYDMFSTLDLKRVSFSDFYSFVCHLGLRSVISRKSADAMVFMLMCDQSIQTQLHFNALSYLQDCKQQLNAGTCSLIADDLTEEVKEAAFTIENIWNGIHHGPI